MTRTRAGIVGYTGYSGAELVRILRGHPRVAPVLVDQDDRPVTSQPFASTDGLEHVRMSEDALRGAAIEVVFLATPPEVSIALAPVALAAGARVIDLSGGFRLDSAAAHERWYRARHGRPELLGEAVYGLPELHGAAIRTARLVANPGCYATAASLALQPLVATGVIDRASGVVCDAKSGVTGAGKRPTSRTHFCEVAEDISAYGFFDHRHVGEILAATGLDEPELSFMTQLLPVRRGILASIYFRTAAPTTWEALKTVYDAAYGASPFVRVYPRGAFPSLRSVVGSNHIDLGIEVDPGTRRAIVVATIDNLIKGAAGQAVQNMNLMLGLDQTCALA